MRDRDTTLLRGWCFACVHRSLDSAHRRSRGLWTSKDDAVASSRPRGQCKHACTAAWAVRLLPPRRVAGNRLCCSCCIYVAQVLLAVAAGAWLLTPEWVSASLQAGHWLPEAPFQAQARRPWLCTTVLHCCLPPPIPIPPKMRCMHCNACERCHKHKLYRQVMSGILADPHQASSLGAGHTPAHALMLCTQLRALAMTIEP